MIEGVEKSRLFNSFQSRQDFIIVDLAEEMVFKGTQQMKFFAFGGIPKQIEAIQEIE